MDFMARCSYVIAVAFLCGGGISSASEPGSGLLHYAQRPSPPDIQPRLLFRTRLGDVIEDGVGYGGVRLGMSEDELDKMWGNTVVAPNARGNYLAHAFRLDTGEFILVQIKEEKVASIAFLITPEAFSKIPELRPTPLKTAKGVELGKPFERVAALYGKPEREEARFWFYSSYGIGFARETTVVYAIIVFEKGRSVTSREVIP